MCVVNAVTLYSGGSLKKTRYLIFPLVKVNILDKILAWNFKKKLCSLVLMCLFCLISSKWIIPPFNFCLLNTDTHLPCYVYFLLLIKKSFCIFSSWKKLFHLNFLKTLVACLGCNNYPVYIHWQHFSLSNMVRNLVNKYSSFSLSTTFECLILLFMKNDWGIRRYVLSLWRYFLGW